MAPETLLLAKRLFDVLTKGINWMAKRKERDLSNFQNLADRKFTELEQIHQEFADRIAILRSTAQSAEAKLTPKSNLTNVFKELRKGIKKVDGLRRQKTDLRRQLYEEARAFDEVRLESDGIVQAIPHEIIDSLHAFLRTFSEYFESSATYSHDLARTYNFFQLSLEKLEGSREGAKQIRARTDVDATLRVMIDEAKGAEEALRGKWAKVAAAYHSLNAILLKHGLGRKAARGRSAKRSKPKETS